MSRVIKFRAWDPINERFYKNPFIAFDEYGVDAYDDQREWEDGIRRNSILMQFTGLKDYAGADIYEGDILGGNGHGDAVVAWNPECACFETYSMDPVEDDEGETHLRKHGDMLSNDLRECEGWKIIGNIYENPELVQASSTPEGAAK